MLNAEGVPGPGGRPWGDTTIRGQVDRGTGLLNNPLYVGRLEWNRTSYVKDPRTGRRTARVNASNKRETIEVPELRIVDDDLWARVKAARRRSASRWARMATAMPSTGRIGVSSCSAAFAGLRRLRRRLHHRRQGPLWLRPRRSKGTCSNGATITRQAIEERVLAA